MMVAPMPSRIPPQAPAASRHPDKDGRVTPYHPAKHTEDELGGLRCYRIPPASRKIQTMQDNLGPAPRRGILCVVRECGFRFDQTGRRLVFDGGANCPCAAAAARFQDEQPRCRWEAGLRADLQGTNDYQPPSHKNAPQRSPPCKLRRPDRFALIRAIGRYQMRK